MYNAIRCNSQKCKSGEHYAIPIKQTPDDCPNMCMNAECKALVSHESIQGIHRQVMEVTMQCEHDIGRMEHAYKTIILKKLHPNHFLALRAQERISLIVGKLVQRNSQYYKNAGQTILKPDGFVHHKKFLEHFKRQIEMYRILQFGRVDVPGFPYLLVSIYNLLLIQKLADDIQRKKTEPLESFVGEMESIQSEWKEVWRMYKLDPMSSSSGLSAHKLIHDTHVKFLQSVVETRVSSWHSVPPVFKLFFGK